MKLSSEELRWRAVEEEKRWRDEVLRFQSKFFKARAERDELLEQRDELLAACERGGIEERDMKGPELLRLAARYLGEYDHKELHWLLNRKADAEEAAIAKVEGEDDDCA